MPTCRHCGSGSVIPPYDLSRSSGPEGRGRRVWRWRSPRRLRQKGGPGGFFVRWSPIPGPGYVASAIGEALGLSDVTVLDLPKRAQGACAGHPTLLVLDNFEHVLASAPLVADLLASVVSLRVLVTSRASLRLRGEREYSVGSLSLDVDVDAIALADLERS